MIFGVPNDKLIPTAYYTLHGMSHKKHDSGS